MDNINEYLLAEIYKYLLLEDIYNCGLVSKNLSKGLSVNSLWEYKYNNLNEEEKIELNKNSKEIIKDIILIKKLKNEIGLKYSVKEIYNKKKLDLSYNNLSLIPSSIDRLVNLQKLNLYNNKLSSMPESIDYLVNLEYLHLGNNKLSSIPEFILMSKYNNKTTK